MTGQTTARAAGEESFTTIYTKDVAAQPQAISSVSFSAAVKLCIAFSDPYTYTPVLLCPGETKNLEVDRGTVEVTLNKAGERASVDNPYSAFVGVLFIGVA